MSYLGHTGSEKKHTLICYLLMPTSANSLHNLFSRSLTVQILFLGSAVMLLKRETEEKESAKKLP